MKHKVDVAPGEIRAIRERLGLTQDEAGGLIGGGPRAFTKYESGTVKPAAAVVNLLRVLGANPAALRTLQGRESWPPVTGAPSPFEVVGTDIADLTSRTFPEMMRRLLYAEAWANDIPLDGIHVASNIDAPDGGEDARIEWNGGRCRTHFLPSRLNQFQFKTGKISRTTARREALTKKGTVKAMVRSALKDGGHYIMLCAHCYVHQEIQYREDRIREAIRGAGMTINDDQVDFWDADQIAAWVNCYPPVATWVKEQAGRGTIPFHSWNHWAARAEHVRSPWVEDERLPDLRALLCEKLTEPCRSVRIVGLSGIGKSRLVLETLGSSGEGDTASRFACDIVMYAVQSEAGAEDINRVVQNLAESGARAVVVVDDCDLGTHRILAGVILRKSSRLSLITIEDEVRAGTLDETTLKIGEASSDVIGSIIDRVAPGLPSVDRFRLVRFSSGFPKIALALGMAWRTEIPFGDATGGDLVDAFVQGGRPQEPDLLLKSAQLLAAFGLVRVEPDDGGQLAEVASFGRNLDADDLYVAIDRLIDQGVVLRRGKFVILQPHPIAMKLAERQWKEWTEQKRDKVLSGDIDPSLKISAARQLALLDTTGIAGEVVAHVCRRDGPFDSLAGVSKGGHAEVLSALAEIGPEAVTGQIERSLELIGDLRQIQGELQRHLVRALEKIVFRADTFQDGARLLLLLAVAEKKNAVANASGRFKSLFPMFLGTNTSSQFESLFSMFLGSTEANGDARFRFLDEAADTDDPIQRAIIVEALLAGCEMAHFSRTVGAEVQGSRPALESWHPTTSREAFAYIEACVKRLGRLALAAEEPEDGVLSSLGIALAPLVRNGFIDTVETVVRQVIASVGVWPAALRGLKSFLAYYTERVDPAVVRRVSSLVAELEPKSLESRVRGLVIEPPMPMPGNEGSDFTARYERDLAEVRELAAELLGRSAALFAFLPQLSRGRQQLADALGKAVAELADAPLTWLEPMIQAVVETPEGERNHDLLSGFVVGLAVKHAEEVDAFKQKAARLPELAPAFLLVCARLGITSSDIQLTVGALQGGSLPPWELNQWACGGVLSRIPATMVTPLLDAMIDHSAEAFAEAINLIGSYSFDAPGKLDEFRPQILKLAENATRWKPTSDRWPQNSDIYRYHFERIINYMLDKGRDDRDARAIALALARALAKVERYDDSHLMEPALCKLLSNFPEISWPLIGQAIIDDEKRAKSLRYILGQPLSPGLEIKPVILNLPVDTLFAWCHANPDRAPAFAAKTVPVLGPKRDCMPKPSLHPIMCRLLEEFGDRRDVQQAVESNIHTLGWWGSQATHLGIYEEPLIQLLKHPKPGLRRWAGRTLGELRTAIERASAWDQERKAQWDVQPNLT